MIKIKKVEYLKPIRIVDHSKVVYNKEALFDNDEDQIDFKADKYFSIKGKGFVVLDFGKEINGGIRILHAFEKGNHKNLHIRIRFGESLSECYSNLGQGNSINSQSVRDAILPLPTITDFNFGNTGFRFVRIDFLTRRSMFNIVNIYARSDVYDFNQIGSFECDDNRLNDIYKVSVNTLKLCCQDYIYDGIKRDRLVWIGDAEAEVKAFLYTYGDNKIINNTLVHAEKHDKLPSWFGRIPSYNAWYLETLYNYYLNTNNKLIIMDRLDFINQTLKQFDNCITDKGIVDFTLDNIDFRGYYIDWPSFKDKDASKAYKYLIMYVIRHVKELFIKLGLDTSCCESILNKLDKSEDYEFERKQFNAFKVLTSNKLDNNLYEKLSKDNASGMSCFMSYYILSATSMFNASKALDMAKEFFGSMIDLGATTFFEEHDMKWVKNTAPIYRLKTKKEHDYHRDFGIECYKGYRESLCHGWSSSCIQFFIEKIVGLKILEPGFRKIEIKPNMGYLKYIKVSIPTIKGVLNIELVKENNNVNIITNDIGIEIIK